MLYLRDFENINQYNAYTASTNFVGPNVSYIPGLQAGKRVKYIKNKPAPPDTTLVMKFRVTSAPQNIILFDVWGSSSYQNINYIEIDGVEADVDEIVSNEGIITATITGEHVVKYRFMSATSVLSNIFADCGSYTSIYVPDGLTTLGDYFMSFGNVDNNLEEIVINPNNPNYDSRNDCNAVIETSTNKIMLGCKNTVIPNDVVSIENWAFAYIQGLQNLVIGNNLTEIGAQAFRYNDVINTVDIGTSITSIGTQAFANCSDLASVTIRATTPPTIGVYVFDHSPCTIYVPSGSVNTYKSAENWSRYASSIEAIS
jgi:hypothetical protein